MIYGYFYKDNNSVDTCCQKKSLKSKFNIWNPFGRKKVSENSKIHSLCLIRYNYRSKLKDCLIEPQLAPKHTKITIKIQDIQTLWKHTRI